MVSEETGGDCYKANGILFMCAMLGVEDAFLVHGTITPILGPLAGVTHGHAWIEVGDQIIDVSNKKDRRIPRSIYHAIAGFDENAQGSFTKYSLDHFARLIAKHKHWGPFSLYHDEKAAITEQTP